MQLHLLWVNRKTTIFMSADLSTTAVPNQPLFTLINPWEFSFKESLWDKSGNACWSHFSQFSLVHHIFFFFLHNAFCLQGLAPSFNDLRSFQPQFSLVVHVTHWTEVVVGVKCVNKVIRNLALMKCPLVRVRFFIANGLVWLLLKGTGLCNQWQIF